MTTRTKANVTGWEPMRAQSIKKQNILSAGLQVTFDSSFEFDDHLKEYLVRSNAIQDRVLHQVVNCSIKN